jgi:hypothetical protein
MDLKLEPTRVIPSGADNALAMSSADRAGAVDDRQPRADLDGEQG